MKSKFTVLFASLILASGAVLAVDLAEFSKVLTQGGGVLQKLLWAAAIVVGILLIAAAFTQFQIHRRNPKLVPLTTPVMYLILGIVAIALPFLDTTEGFLGTKVDRIKSTPDESPKGPGRNPQYVNPNDIDAPIYK